MNTKAKTLLKLLIRGDMRAIGVRTRLFLRAHRLKKAKSPFVYRYGKDRMVCDPTIPDSRSYFLEKVSDAFERSIFRLWLRGGDVVVDAGANAGLFTAVASDLVGESGEVLAIEPTPALAGMIARNAQLLGHPKTKVIEAALGRTAGRAKFAFAPDDATAVSQSLAVGDLPGDAGTVREVEVVSLAEAAAAVCQEPALVKLDVEGAEHQALQGCPPTWRTKEGPLWVIECHPLALERFGIRPEHIYEMLPADEFECFVIGKYAGDHGADLAVERLDRDKRPAAMFWNLVAVPLGGCWADRRKQIAPLLPPLG